MRTSSIGFLLLCAVGAARADFNDESWLGPMDSATADAPFGGYLIVADEVSARRGETIELSVFLSAPTPSIAVGTTHDLTFDRDTFVPADGSDADCMINPDIERPFGFGLPPNSCNPNRDCTAIRVLFIAVQEPPIPDRARLYTCRVSISPRARLGWHPFRVSNVNLHGRAGDIVEPTRGVDGGVYVIDDDMTSHAPDSGGCHISGTPNGSPEALWILVPLGLLAVGLRTRRFRASWPK